MKAKVKALLLEALRSGRFKRTTCALQETDIVTNKKGQEREVISYCVVGVLCELHRVHTKGGEWKDGYYVINGKRKGYTSLPEEVAKWAGLIKSKSKRNGQTVVKYASDITWIDTDGQEVSVIDLNDNYARGKGLSFKKIADLIETNVS